MQLGQIQKWLYATSETPKAPNDHNNLNKGGKEAKGPLAEAWKPAFGLSGTARVE